MQVVVDPDNSLVWDVKLPDRDKNDTSMLAMLQETLRCLAVAGQQSGEEGAAEGAQGLSSQLEQLLAGKGAQGMQAAQGAAGAGQAGGVGAAGAAAAASAAAGTGPTPFQHPNLMSGLEVPVLQTPVVGQVSMRR